MRPVLLPLLLLVAGLTICPTAAGRVHSRALPLLWHTHEDIAIFESVQFSNHGKNVVAGKGYNDDALAQIEVFNTVGRGVPLWAHQGPDYEVAGARHVDFIAGVSWNSTSGQAVVSGWHSGSAEPLWSFPVPLKVAIPDGQCAIFVTDDGSKVILLVTVLTNPQRVVPRVYWFTSVNTPKPSVSFLDLPAGGAARDLSCTPTGQFAAVSAGALVHVVDTVAKSIRSSVNFGFSTVALCISPDGMYLGHGFTTMYFLQWNQRAGNYSVFGSYSPATNGNEVFLAWQCAIARNGVAATTWSSGDYHRKVATAHSLVAAGRATLLFKYDFGLNENTKLQDVPSGIAIADDGSAFAQSSWGDGGHAATVAVFSVKTGKPVYTMATVGSMNDVDLFVVGHTAYVTAAGKATHNNVMGDGGDIYSLQVSLQ